MAHYQQRGSIPPKRHTRHGRPEGGICYEELMGEEGFVSNSALLYHRRPPSAIVDARAWELGRQLRQPNRPLLARHLRLHELFPGKEWKALDAVTGRRVVLGNDDVRISYVACGAPSPLYRDAIGDECVFVEGGNGLLETAFGPVGLGPGDYAVIPRGTLHRIVPSSNEALRLYCIESSGHIAPPKRYLSRFGQFLEHSPYCERDLRPPGDPPDGGGEPAEVYVKHRAPVPGGVGGSIHVMASHPFDVVGWDGCLYPYAFNVADFEPITGRVHQPPPAHQVFEGPRFVICNFVPRKVDYHPGAIPVPYYHSNVDSDEVMFYSGGEYRARSGSGIGPGSVSLHPAGFVHGPQAGAYESSTGTEAVDELAVMIDAHRPLELGEGGLSCEDPGYAWSWAGGRAPERR